MERDFGLSDDSVSDSLLSLLSIHHPVVLSRSPFLRVPLFSIVPTYEDGTHSFRVERSTGHLKRLVVSVPDKIPSSHI